jgi:hypothetical protein
MDIERKYLDVLDLTRHMSIAATSQNWDNLIVLENQRGKLLADIPQISSISRASFAQKPALAQRIAEIIEDIERENSIITEQVQAWKKDVRILLRLDKPAII